MGNCCARQEVVEISSNRSTTYSRHSSILFEKYSKQTDYRKKYEYISMLGSGAFGKVRLFRDRQCKLLRAIKTIKKDFFNSHSINSIIREVEILRSLDHPNIVKYFETYEDEKYLHIVMEYIPGDNLFKVITGGKYLSLSEREVSHIIQCLFKAILFLHHNGIVHRDIKPDNILFATPGNYQTLKLIDFGLAIQRNAKRENYRVGTPYYMAPEMIKGNFVFESDIWSVGVILFVMITAKQPFRGKDKQNVFEKISQGRYDYKTLEKAKCSNELKDLIKKIIVKDPHKRIAISSALEHPWFKLFEESNENKVISKDILDSLKNFQKANLFQKEILFYLAKISKEKEIEKLKQAFSIIDKDNSGEIEYDEIPKVFRESGIEITDKELQQIFNSLDFHCDGKVNYSEFLAGTITSIEFMKEEKLWSAFKYFDANDTGYITYDSVIAALKQSGVVVDQKGLTETFKQLQKEGKKINFDEFKQIVGSRKND